MQVLASTRAPISAPQRERISGSFGQNRTVVRSCHLVRATAAYGPTSAIELDDEDGAQLGGEPGAESEVVPQ